MLAWKHIIGAYRDSVYAFRFKFQVKIEEEKRPFSHDFFERPTVKLFHQLYLLLPLFFRVALSRELVRPC